MCFVETTQTMWQVAEWTNTISIHFTYGLLLVGLKWNERHADSFGGPKPFNQFYNHIDTLKKKNLTEPWVDLLFFQPQSLKSQNKIQAQIRTRLSHR